jgi:hypothetical protein
MNSGAEVSLQQNFNFPMHNQPPSKQPEVLAPGVSPFDFSDGGLYHSNVGGFFNSNC